MTTMNCVFPVGAKIKTYNGMVGTITLVNPEIRQSWIPCKNSNSPNTKCLYTIIIIELDKKDNSSENIERAILFNDKPIWHTNTYRAELLEIDMNRVYADSF